MSYCCPVPQRTSQSGQEEVEQSTKKTVTLKVNGDAHITGRLINPELQQTIAELQHRMDVLSRKLDHPYVNVVVNAADISRSDKRRRV